MATFNGVWYPPCCCGCRGPRGPKGERGPRGPKGEKGDKGNTGRRGTKGDTATNDNAYIYNTGNENVNAGSNIPLNINKIEGSAITHTSGNSQIELTEGTYLVNYTTNLKSNTKTDSVSTAVVLDGSVLTETRRQIVGDVSEFKLMSDSVIVNAKSGGSVLQIRNSGEGSQRYRKLAVTVVKLS